MRLKACVLSMLLFSLGCARGPSIEPTPSAGLFDVIIANGRIVDGTGNAWFYGDIGVRDDRIAAIVPRGLLRDATATERFDASGLVVAPGFIDIQSHSRGSLLYGDGRVVSKITQGITTEILGEGATNAPANRLTLSETGDPSPEDLERAAPFMGPDGFGNWLEAMETHGVTPNIGSFVGAATIRVYAKGMAMGEATPLELDSMRTAVRWSMEGGAFGIASALIYPPGSYASTEELIEINKAMAPYGGVYITHLRSEADQFIEGLREAIEIGVAAHVPVEVYHLKAGGVRNWHKPAHAIALIDSARAAGIDIQADMYPYTAGSTGLTACLPPWTAADGLLLENLRNPETRARIREEILNQTTDWENLCVLSTPENVLILGLEKPENQQFSGLRLAQIAERQGKHWIETAMDLIVSEESRVGAVYFMMSESNVMLQMHQPWIKFGTDAGGVDPDSARGLTHPRAYGTYPRILGKYVREERVMPLEEAIRKMSSAVTTRLSIQDRGILREGMYADIVMFDPTTIIDNATFEEPHQLSVGMQHVLVNGVPVVRDGRHTGAKPGIVVRGPGYIGNR
jgi:dihydroorotase/N-acyl-D-amino-acid deacylase